MTGATSGAGTAYPSRAPEFTPGFCGIRVRYSIFSFMCICFVVAVTQWPKEEEQTTQWPKEERQTTQWPKEERQTTQWPKEEEQTTQWPKEKGQKDNQRSTKHYT
jgi:hypothetical protein